MSHQSRVAPGVPSGGQFTAASKPESAVELSEAPRESLQTDAPIERLTMTNLNRSCYWLVSMVEDSNDDRLDVDQPYQRGHVWGSTRQAKLIRSLMDGTTIPPIIVNNRMGAGFHEPGYSDERNWATAVIDGKQRTTAVMDFVRDKYAVPASWFPAEHVNATEDTEDGAYVRWSGLSDVAHRRFGNLPFGVCEGRFKSLAEEEEIFERVNFGGVAQGGSDFTA